MTTVSHYSFPASVQGYYHFTVQKESNNGAAFFRIFKEGVQVLYNDAWFGSADDTPVSTSSFILKLLEGERVTVVNQITAGTVIYGVLPGTSVYRSWFSGFLLHAF